MQTLRLSQSAVGLDRFRVDATFMLNGQSNNVTTDFEFPFTAQEREDIRWYLEDYLQQAADPAPKIASRIEGNIVDAGTKLFRAIFESSDEARGLWEAVRSRLNDTRIEIATSPSEATALPWELMRDPEIGRPLATCAAAFVRSPHLPSEITRRLERPSGKIRILLVICRPSGGADVPFRSVASRLIKSVGEKAREAFELTVLRPPTVENLINVLGEAKTAGEPFNIVHFDGHGTYEDVTASLSGQPRHKFRGYLIFENPEFQGNRELVHGTDIGTWLAQSDVPVLVLNACRSAHVEAISQPQQVRTDAKPADTQSTVRPFGSLAQEVIEAGVPGVVAMLYNVYVGTAAQFVADLYESLAVGSTLGESVSSGRLQLNTSPLREFSYPPRALQDWMVPVAYETAPVKLLHEPRQETAKRTTVKDHPTSPASSSSANELKRLPEAGFIGRDETLLELDRAFDSRRIVLLYGYAGSGKTETAAEFARWYHLTGGVDAPVLITSFERKKTLHEVLSHTFAGTFAPVMERLGIHWAALSRDDRVERVLQFLDDTSVLWIWDNVEPIAAFPPGTSSQWSSEEQQELAEFLSVAGNTKAKFLLTSRREEREWLNDLPERIKIPPMPMADRVQMTRALHENHGRPTPRLEDWISLLRFTAGNPLTLTVLVNQLLHDGLETQAEIDTFVGVLRHGNAEWRCASEGHEQSLAASLEYGFDHAFSDIEREQLSLLHLFQGYVTSNALCMMGDVNQEWCLPALRDTDENTVTNLLNRCADAGLLSAVEAGYYAIHPAVPWFLKRLFHGFYPNSANVASDIPSNSATRAYVEAVGWLGEHAARTYATGDRQVIAILELEHDNLVHAFHLARESGLYNAALRSLHALRTLYEDTGRKQEWTPFLDLIIPDVVDPDTDGPQTGYEEEWCAVTEMRAVAAERSDEAERLSRLIVNFNRSNTADFSELPALNLNDQQRYDLRLLAVAIERLGSALFSRGEPECLEHLEESQSIYHRIGDHQAEAVIALKIAMAYALPSLSMPDQQLNWLKRSYELRPESDRIGRAKCLERMGGLAFADFVNAVTQHSLERSHLQQLENAIACYDQAVRILPNEASWELAGANYGLARALRELTRFMPREVELIANVLKHYQDAIRHFEDLGDNFHAGGCRLEASSMLAHNGRLSDAREYALAALRDFEGSEGPSGEFASQARSLLDQITHHLTAEGE